MNKQTLFSCQGPFRTDKNGNILRNEVGQGLRKGCGASMDAAILAVPEDGTIHEVTCAKCGTIATVRRTAPEFTSGG